MSFYTKLHLSSHFYPCLVDYYANTKSSNNWPKKAHECTSLVLQAINQGLKQIFFCWSALNLIEAIRRVESLVLMTLWWHTKHSMKQLCRESCGIKLTNQVDKELGQAHLSLFLRDLARNGKCWSQTLFNWTLLKYLGLICMWSFLRAMPCCSSM